MDEDTSTLSDGDKRLSPNLDSDGLEGDVSVFDPELLDDDSVLDPEELDSWN